MDSWIPHHFSAAGVHTNADECLDAVQSNLTGPVAIEVSLPYIGLSSIEDDGLKIDLKVVTLKVDLEAW